MNMPVNKHPIDNASVRLPLSLEVKKQAQQAMPHPFDHMPDGIFHGHAGRNAKLRQPRVVLDPVTRQQIPEKMARIIREWLDVPDRVLLLLALLLQAYEANQVAAGMLLSTFAVLSRELTSNAAKSIRDQGVLELGKGVAMASVTGATTVAGGIANYKGARARSQANALAGDTPDVTQQKNLLNQTADRRDSLGRSFDGFGRTLNSAIGGGFEGATMGLRATQKMQEQDKESAQGFKENEMQHKNSLLDVSKFFYDAFDAIAQSNKQARDAVADACRV